ncbi:MAG: AI-2E family transporter [Planctomycetes bacterium]|nr:AI-2E family transporter [Planctomycetota bacterium]MBI3410143.1 AI-2E family transporter [Planctomycetota bacterium]
MEESADSETPQDAALGTDQATFLQRLAIVTLSLGLVALLIYFLREFRTILQPLFIAIFIGYILMPIHAWLVRRGIPSVLAYVVMLALILGALFGLGTLVYRNADQLIDRLPEYDKKLQGFVKQLAGAMNLDETGCMEYYRKLTTAQDQSVEQGVAQLRQTLGTFLNFFSMTAITFIYLVFLIAERVSFPRRLALAFGEKKGEEVQAITTSINVSISQYIAIVTFVSVLAGVLSMALLAIFRVDFFVTWGILICLFNFIPYIGSIVAVALPILLSLVQLGVWQALVIAVLLIAIQEVIALGIQPRLAGRKLGVSPLLILLSLAFWGVVWGIVGMILAVPLLMIIKIILENIKETRPLSILMSNV